MTNIPYIMIVIANSFIFFILTGIQYWVTDYLVNTIEDRIRLMMSRKLR